ncbi:hypothetical protein DYL61_26410 [Pseudomonas nabeulensis]|uniref:Uncharacterized protein n=1 Tax=Pseudomonas nabeulensis TaxID=2293833 RepID=A0A4Z0AKR5_9PSED|nr:hypothetical protein [Pseudomonas nabeulensis]TFY87352.1 hypothetical protein DYL61_26410 [Pseudomonas nabeulensis]
MHAVETTLPAPRADVWAVNSAHCQAHYQIIAEAEPDVLCRVLNFFALQFLIPREVLVNREEDLLNITIVMDGLSWHRAQVIGEKIRNLISVCSLEVLAADAVGLEAVVAIAR